MKTVLDASCCLSSPSGLDDCRTGCWCWGRWETMKVCTAWRPSEGWSAGSRLRESWRWWRRPGPTHGRHLGGSGWGQAACAEGWLLPPCRLLSGPHRQGPANTLWMHERGGMWTQQFIPTILIPIPSTVPVLYLIYDCCTFASSPWEVTCWKKMCSVFSAFFMRKLQRDIQYGDIIIYIKLILLRAWSPKFTYRFI